MSFFRNRIYVFELLPGWRITHPQIDIQPIFLLTFYGWFSIIENHTSRDLRNLQQID
jgi:hypothetical protein